MQQERHLHLYAPTRRSLLAGLPLATLGTQPLPETVVPLQADSFVDSVGVCVHLDSAPYSTQFERVATLLGELGVRHLRDELRPENDLTRWRELHSRFGIRSHLLVSPTTNTVSEMLDYLASFGAARVSAIEGQNEGDSDWFRAQRAARPDWSRAVIDYQRAVFSAVRSRYPREALPVVSPALLDYKPGDVGRIAEAAPFCDWVAVHPYAQGGQEPETAAPYAGLPWYLQTFRDRFKPGAPAIATEAGYHNATAGKNGISAAAAAKYLPRLLLHAFGLGLVRTFLYELMDESADLANSEHNYGLLRSDSTPKPAYRALQNLMRALADPGPPFRPAPLAITFQPPTPGLRVATFAKRDGAVYLAIWRTERSWDPDTARDLDVAPVPVRVVVGRRFRRAAVLRLGSPDGWNVSPAPADSFTASIADEVILLHLAP